MFFFTRKTKCFIYISAVSASQVKERPWPRTPGRSLSQCTASKPSNKAAPVRKYPPHQLLFICQDSFSFIFFVRRENWEREREREKKMFRTISVSDKVDPGIRQFPASSTNNRRKRNKCRRISTMTSDDCARPLLWLLLFIYFRPAVVSSKDTHTLTSFTCIKMTECLWRSFFLTSFFQNPNVFLCSCDFL